MYDFAVPGAGFLAKRRIFFDDNHILDVAGQFRRDTQPYYPRANYGNVRFVHRRIVPVLAELVCVWGILTYPELKNKQISIKICRWSIFRVMSVRMMRMHVNPMPMLVGVYMDQVIGL